MSCSYIHNMWLWGVFTEFYCFCDNSCWQNSTKGLKGGISKGRKFSANVWITVAKGYVAHTNVKHCKHVPRYTYLYKMSYVTVTQFRILKNKPGELENIIMILLLSNDEGNTPEPGENIPF